VAEPLNERLTSATARLIGRPVTRDDRFGLAVSGGADSMAMLVLAAACWPGQVEAATVDHGLRPEAGDEAAKVAGWCAAHGIAHATLRPDQPISGNLQSQARNARYALLEQWRADRGLDWLLTAHQADDQIETVIMRLNRGSGVGGLAAIRGRQGRVLRPLLDTRRAELRDYCAANVVPFIDDPSNADPRFDRARLRGQLAGFDVIDPARLNRSVEALAEADAALDWMVHRLMTDHVTAKGQALILDATELPAALLRRLVEKMIHSINESAEIPRGPSMDQALVQLFDGKTVTLGGCIVTGGDRWSVRRAPPRRSEA